MSDEYKARLLRKNVMLATDIAIAALIGLEVREDSDGGTGLAAYVIATGELWHPSICWAQCGPLLERYRVQVIVGERGVAALCSGYRVFGHSATEAICSVIVVAHHHE